MLKTLLDRPISVTLMMLVVVVLGIVSTRPADLVSYAEMSLLTSLVRIHLFHVFNQLFVQSAILLVYDEDELLFVALISRRNLAHGSC